MLIMVRFEEETTSNKQPITKELFLKSLGKWYPKGIELRVDEVSDRVFEDKFNKSNKPSCILFVTFEIIGNMKKCMSYVVDNGEYVLDDFDGKMKEVIDGTNQKVKATFKMIPLNSDDVQDEESEYKIESTSGFYPLLKFGMLQNDIVDKVKPRQSLIVTFDEILDSLEDLEFIATSKHIKSKKYSYDLLIPKKIDNNLDNFVDSDGNDGFEIVNPSD